MDSNTRKLGPLPITSDDDRPTTRLSKPAAYRALALDNPTATARQLPNSTDHTAPALAPGDFYYDEQMMSWFGRTPGGVKVRLPDPEYGEDGVLTFAGYIGRPHVESKDTKWVEG
jgi:hypothetical protein